MNKRTILTGFIVLGCTIGPITGALIYEKYQTSDLTAEITARSPERGNFTPNTLTVKKNEKVRLRVRNVIRLCTVLRFLRLGSTLGK